MLFVLLFHVIWNVFVMFLDIDSTILTAVRSMLSLLLWSSIGDSDVSK